MARLKLEKISLIVSCDCSAQFVAEDLEPVCPYCNRKYKVSISSAKEKVNFKIAPALQTPTQSCTK